MTTGFGIDPILNANGDVTVGTTSDDLRRITGSLYSPGLISGGDVTRSSTALTYSVSNGVAAFPIVVDNSKPPKPQNRRTVLGPIPATVLNTTAPATGTRVDIIYAQQLTPATDNDSNVVVKIGTSLPARSVLLDSYIVSAGQANTNLTTRTGNIAFSIPYGASLGTLVNKTVLTSPTLNTTTKHTVISGSFYLPTDRAVNAFVTAGFSAVGAVRFSDTTYCEAGLELAVGGVTLTTWTTVGLHQAWAETTYREGYYFAEGTHTFTLKVFRATGPGTPILRNRGIQLMIQDIGPTV